MAVWRTIVNKEKKRKKERYRKRYRERERERERKREREEHNDSLQLIELTHFDIDIII